MWAWARVVGTSLPLSWLFKLVAALGWRWSASIHTLSGAELVSSSTRSAAWTPRTCQMSTAHCGLFNFIKLCHLYITWHPVDTRPLRAVHRLIWPWIRIAHVFLWAFHISCLNTGTARRWTSWPRSQHPLHARVLNEQIKFKLGQSNFGLFFPDRIYLIAGFNILGFKVRAKCVVHQSRSSYFVAANIAYSGSTVAAHRTLCWEKNR